MRGIAAPFELSYVPGQWLESIQVSKGLSTVVNGVESITGQINTEYRKPTDEKPLFVNLSAMNDTKTDRHPVAFRHPSPAGQSLGQKNTVFAIWMGYTFMTPETAIVGGLYSIWHNIYNSWQLYRAENAGT